MWRCDGGEVALASWRVGEPQPFGVGGRGHLGVVYGLADSVVGGRGVGG